MKKGVTVDPGHSRPTCTDSSTIPRDDCVCFIINKMSEGECSEFSGSYSEDTGILNSDESSISIRNESSSEESEEVRENSNLNSAVILNEAVDPEISLTRFKHPDSFKICRSNTDPSSSEPINLERGCSLSYSRLDESEEALKTKPTSDTDSRKNHYSDECDKVQTDQFNKAIILNESIDPESEYQDFSSLPQSRTDRSSAESVSNTSNRERSRNFNSSRLSEGN